MRPVTTDALPSGPDALPTPRFPIQWKVLALLSEFGPQSTATLSREFDIALEPLRYFLDLLSEEGYIERDGNGGNRWRSCDRWDPYGDVLKAEATE